MIKAPVIPRRALSGPNSQQVAEPGPKAVHRQSVFGALGHLRSQGGKLAEVLIAAWNKGDSQDAELSERKFPALIGEWTIGLNRRVALTYLFHGRTQSRCSARSQWQRSATREIYDCRSGEHR